MAIPPQQNRYLKELLNEEQEPFHPNPTSAWTFPSTLCSSACFSSSPDCASRRSPLFSSSANNNNSNSSQALFLRVPPKTAALLLDAALRVHKHSYSKTRFRNSGFGLRIGSLIKRLTNRIPTRKRETGDVDDDMGRCRGDEGIVFVNGFERENRGVIGRIGDFCFNHGPVSPSPGPALSSPAMSPSQPQPISQEQEVEEDKEQNNSPVSILDPPFELDDEDGDEDEHQENVDRFDLECSYAFLQRAKGRLLLTLRKFEELAELDPTKLEGRTGEEEKEDGDEYEHDVESEASNGDEFEINEDGFLADKSGLMKDFTKPWMKRLVSDMISEEERLKCSSSSGDDEYDQLPVRRVSDRLESWPEMESNTIEMMVGMDIRGERVKWTKQEQDDEISRAVNEIEFSIFEVLVEELLDEFVSCSTVINHVQILCNLNNIMSIL